MWNDFATREHRVSFQRKMYVPTIKKKHVSTVYSNAGRVVHTIWIKNQRKSKTLKKKTINWRGKEKKKNYWNPFQGSTNISVLMCSNCELFCIDSITLTLHENVIPIHLLSSNCRISALKTVIFDDDYDDGDDWWLAI